MDDPPESPDRLGQQSEEQETVIIAAKDVAPFDPAIVNVPDGS